MPWSVRLKMKAGTNWDEGRKSLFGVVSIVVADLDVVLSDTQANTIRRPGQEGG
jgi:hypothetical protein